MQRYIFKPGDNVNYNLCPGVLLGLFDSGMGFFFADRASEHFDVAADLIYADFYHSLFKYYVDKYFGDPNPSILTQNRFAIVNVCHLKPQATRTTIGSLNKKRHLLIKMISDYIKLHKSPEDLDRVFDWLESIQIKIDYMESRAKSFLEVCK